MSNYRVYLRLGALEVLKGMHGAAKRRVAEFVDSLEQDPNQAGDYTEKDAVHRDIEIKVVGPYAVVYWADHPVREVKVVDIRRADRA